MSDYSIKAVQGRIFDQSPLVPNDSYYAFIELRSTRRAHARMLAQAASRFSLPADFFFKYALQALQRRETRGFSTLFNAGND